MIRLFSVFCKLNFIKLNAKQLFNEAVSRASMHRFPCPFCGALHPDWAYFESYERHLVAFEQGVCADHTVSVTRYQCGSCGHTHALLPEIAIPYSPYYVKPKILMPTSITNTCITIKLLSYINIII